VTAFSESVEPGVERPGVSHPGPTQFGLRPAAKERELGAVGDALCDGSKVAGQWGVCVEGFRERYLKARVRSAQPFVDDARMREVHNTEAGGDEADNGLGVVCLLNDFGAEAGFAADGDYVVVEPGSVFSHKEDERLWTERLDGDGLAPGERVHVGKRRKQFLLYERGESERRVAHWRAHETDVEVPGAEGGNLRPRRHLLKLEFRFRVPLVKRTQNRGQDDVARCADEADPQLSYLADGGSAQQLFCPLYLCQERPRSLQ
jgi:hypothetical protein